MKVLRRRRRRASLAAALHTRPTDGPIPMHLKPNDLKAALRKWPTATALMLVICGAVQAGQSALNQNARQTLPGHVLPLLKKLQPLVHLPGSAQLHLTIGLPLRDPAGLSD